MNHSLDKLLTKLVLCSAFAPIFGIGTTYMFHHAAAILATICALTTFVLVVVAFDTITDIFTLFQWIRSCPQLAPGTEAAGVEAAPAADVINFRRQS